jgi:RHS repeat-associated protein
VSDSAGALWSGTYVYGAKPYLATETDRYRGTWTYYTTSGPTTVDALGEQLYWTDAKGQAFSATYDALGRMISRKEPDLFTQWTWGSSTSLDNVGQLQSVCTGTGSSPTTCMASGYQESETYDAYGRLATRAIVIPNDKTYTYGFAYNATTGRPNVLTYPSTSAGPALTVQYAYAATGVLQSITDTADSPNVTLWTANAQNPASQYTQETLGNDVVLTHAYDPVTGWPTSVTAVPNGGQSLQNNSFLFDAVGNLIQRTDVNRDFTENIYPDADNRIGYTTINGSPDMTMSYNANGSIKSRVFHAISPSTDDYESPNSLVAESSDARAGGTVQWTSYNQPSYIPGPSNTSSTFYYDHNHQRWQQQADYAGATETTTYIGDLLEKVVTGSGTVYRQYVPAGNSTALYLASGSPPSIYYMTSDHLASTSTITDRNGSLVLEESFSPWGARRDPNNWAAYQSTADAAKLTTTTRHGFTGQEHIDNLGLINMNGRIYQGSSFMSPDPRLQDPTDTQNYQRYSYVDNNALTLFDPTGFDEQAPATQDQNCQNSECGVPVGEVTVTCDLTCQLQYALADLSLELQQQFIFSLQQGGQLVGTTSNNVNAQAPSQCAAPPMSSPNGSTAGDIPHFVAVSYIGHDVPESQLNALFSAWRNGSSWAPGGAPNTQDNTPYLLDEVPGDTGYFNWVFVTTNAQNRTFTNWTLPGHVFAGKVVNSIQTYAGFSFMVSEGSGGTQNIALNAALGPVIFKMLQQSVLNNFSPPQVGNQCGRGPKL